MVTLNKYLTDTIDLVDSLVIKITPMANKLNTRLILNYGASEVDLENPRTWKYYLNLSGIKHSRDTPIYVTDPNDPTNKVEFTKQLLSNSIVIRSKYTINSSSYNKLILDNPNHILYIKGVINPIDIDSSISSADGDILSYDSTLVDDQEYSLIWNISKFIKNYISRWDISGFHDTEVKYTSIWYSILSMLLVNKIINIRMAKSLSLESNNFHISNILSSNMDIGDLVFNISRDKRFSLMKNIKYIRSNFGVKSTDDFVLKILLDNTGYNLNTYKFYHLGTFTGGIRDVGVLEYNSTGTVENELSISDYHNLLDDGKHGINFSTYLQSNIQEITNKLSFTPNNLLYSNTMLFRHRTKLNKSNITKDKVNEWVFDYVIRTNVQNTINLTDPIKITDSTTNTVFNLSMLDMLHSLHYFKSMFSGITPSTSIISERGPLPIILDTPILVSGATTNEAISFLTEINSMVPYPVFTTLDDMIAYSKLCVNLLNRVIEITNGIVSPLISYEVMTGLLQIFPDGLTITESGTDIPYDESKVPFNILNGKYPIFRLKKVFMDNIFGKVLTPDELDELEFNSTVNIYRKLSSYDTNIISSYDKYITYNTPVSSILTGKVDNITTNISNTTIVNTISTDLTYINQLTPIQLSSLTSIYP